MKEIPQFKTRHYDWVKEFISDVLSDKEQSHFHDLVAFDDGHYRAIFSVDYFFMPADQERPSKSQWNNLKKKLKRHNPKVFIFKEHGYLEEHAYLDFGFFAN